MIALVEFLRALAAWTLDAPSFAPELVADGVAGLSIDAGPLLDEPGAPGAVRLRTGHLAVYRSAELGPGRGFCRRGDRDRVRLRR